MDRRTAQILIIASLILLVGGFFSGYYGLMCFGAGSVATLNFVDIRRNNV